MKKIFNYNAEQHFCEFSATIS